MCEPLKMREGPAAIGCVRSPARSGSTSMELSYKVQYSLGRRKPTASGSNILGLLRDDIYKNQVGSSGRHGYKTFLWVFTEDC